MATLYVAEYAGLMETTGGIGQVPREPPLAEQTIAISGSSTPLTNPFQTATSVVRIETDAICSIKFGPNGATVATTGNQRFAANQTEYKAVPRGQSWTVAVITNS
jgi:hypothetical protein